MATRLDTPAGRFYEIDGDRFPSVTHVLGVIGKPALINWAANQERDLVTEAAADLYLDLLKTQPMSRPVYVATLAGRLGVVRAHRRALERASAIGSGVHALIEWTLRKQLGQEVGPEPKADEPVRVAFLAFQTWAQAVNLRPRLIEQVVWSRTHRYAGTMDLLADVNGVPMLIDFKTGKAVYPEAFLQNAAYQVALREMGHEAPAGGLIVRLPKVQSDRDTGEVVTVPPVLELFPVFVAARAVWEWTYQNEQTKERHSTATAPPRDLSPATPADPVDPAGESVAPRALAVSAVAAAGTRHAIGTKSLSTVQACTSVLPSHTVHSTPSLVIPPDVTDFSLTAPAPAPAPTPARRSQAKVLDADLFLEFWHAYPRRTHRAEAVKAFMRLNPDRALLDRMLAALAVQSRSPQWADARYVPHAASWLNGERWTDEIDAPAPVPAAPASFRDGCPHTPECRTPTQCLLLRARAEREGES